MISDAHQVSDGDILKADILVIGAGAAGITLAKEFNHTQKNVLILEGGGLKETQASQNLYEGKNVGLPYSYPHSISDEHLNKSRQRFFGGTTNHWFGMCRPLDALDFEEREGVAHSGWPISYASLQDFYKRAHPLCELKGDVYDEAFISSQRFQDRFLFRDEKVVHKYYRFSPPTRFGVTYHQELSDSKNVHVLLHANVTQLVAHAPSKRIKEIEVKTLSGKSFKIQAKQVVLACGGMENARLLLASNRVQKKGIGNQNDFVGRYFMEHPHQQCGFFLASNDEVAKKMLTWRYRFPLALAASVIREERILNSALTFHRLEDQQAENDLLTKIGQFDSMSTKLQKSKGRSGFRERIFQIISRREQAPNPSSRVFLTDEKDVFGIPKIALDWRLTELDYFTIEKTFEILAAELGARNLGHFYFDSQLSPVEGGAHHMGTTRMSNRPETGVVNEHCRVHDYDNLFIAGSSVFPTSGFANPTLTLIALSIRLADHLKGLAL